MAFANTGTKSSCDNKAVSVNLRISGVYPDQLASSINAASVSRMPDNAPMMAFCRTGACRLSSSTSQRLKY